MVELLKCRMGPLHLAFFFFQAEDGIRDLTVTGVQTCALPISKYQAHHRASFSACVSCRGPVTEFTALNCRPVRRAPRADGFHHPGIDREERAEIGRASCRERV